MKIQRVRKELKTRLKDKQDALFGFPALLGNHDGVVEVPDYPSYVYYRIGEQVGVAYNNRVPALRDLAVFIGKDPLQPHIEQVLGMRPAARYSEDDIPSSATQEHAETHRYMGSGLRGGTDPLWVELRQFMPFRATAAGDLAIYVHRGILWTGSAWETYETSDTIDLADELPTGDSKACYVLVTIDTSGDVITTTGSQVDQADLGLDDIPAAPADTAMVLAAVRLYTGQTEIVEARTDTDIIDLRYPYYHTHDERYTPSADMDLDSLADVTISSPADKELLAYDDSSGEWINQTAEEAGLNIVSIEEQDGTPAVAAVSLIKVSNGHLTDEGGGEVSIAIPDEIAAPGWTLNVDGAIEAVSDVGAFVAQGEGAIQAVYIRCDDPGTAGSTIVDVHKNGTTIFTTQANRPTLAYDDADGVAKSGDPEVTVLAENDVLTVDIDQAATGAENLTVVVVIEWLAINEFPHFKISRAIQSTAQSISTSELRINFDTVEIDEDSCITTGASWKFTAPGNGYYWFHVSIGRQRVEELFIIWYINAVKKLETQQGTCTTTWNSVKGGYFAKLNANDIVHITCKAYANTGDSVPQWTNFIAMYYCT